MPRAQVLAGAVNSASGLENKVALSTIYPNEQIITAKFGDSGEQSALTIPDGDIAISVTLSDTGRVAGFVTPGASVAIFIASPDPKDKGATRLLLPSVKVIAIGTTTVVNTTTTDPAGAADHRGAAQDAVHPGGLPGRRREDHVRRRARRAHVRPG